MLSVRIILVSVLVLFSSGKLFAQEEPPMPIVISGIQNIIFGSFVQLGGVGTISLTHDGTRNGTNVSFVGMGHMSGRFIIEGTEYTPIAITVNDPITLSNGGTGTMSLTINSWSIPFPLNYVLPTSSPSTSTVYFGGTLTVPAGSPSGNYTGNLLFTFIQNYE